MENCQPFSDRNQKGARVTIAGRRSSIEELPDHILIDILSRLSLKTLLACKFVSKTWLYFITKDSDFAMLHYSRSQSELLIQYRDKSYASGTIDLVDVKLRSTRMVDLKPKFQLPKNDPGDNYIVVNSCRGLLSLKDGALDTPCVVCNPVTGEYVMLPEHTEYEYGSLAGLGFSSSTNEFKVLGIFSFTIRRSEWLTVTHKSSFTIRRSEWLTVTHKRAEINVIGSKSWRPIGNAPFSPDRISDPPISLNGAIHWFRHDMSSTHIISFNFESERFEEIPPPSQFGKKHNNRKHKMALGVFGDRLSICDVIWKGCFEIWVLRRYDIHFSWTKVFSVTTAAQLVHCPRIYLSYGIFPVKGLINGEILMVSVDSGLVCYNPVKNSTRFLRFNAPDVEFAAVVHTPSFVSLKDIVAGNDLMVFNVSSRYSPTDSTCKSVKLMCLL